MRQNAKEKSRELKEENNLIDSQTKSEKEVLLDLYQELKNRNIRSIGDLENQIANCK